MLRESLDAFNSIIKENNKHDSAAQQFKREILKNPDAKTPSISSDAELTHSKERPSYNSKYKLTLKTWDDNVESVKLHEARIQYLERTGQIQIEMLKTLNNSVESLNVELEKITHKTWQDNLINKACANKAFTLVCLSLICGIILSGALIGFFLWIG